MAKNTFNRNQTGLLERSGTSHQRRPIRSGRTVTTQTGISLQMHDSALAGAFGCGGLAASRSQPETPRRIFSCSAASKSVEGVCSHAMSGASIPVSAQFQRLVHVHHTQQVGTGGNS